MTGPLPVSSGGTGATSLTGIVVGTGTSPMVGQGGIVMMDSFSGANADAQLANAMSYAAAQTYIPAIMLPPGQTTFNTGGLTPYNGMRILAPFGADGPKNQDVSSSDQNHQIQLNVGTGTSSWFVGASTYYNIYFGDLAILNPAGNGQFWHQPSTAGTLFACQFHGMNFYGFEYIFGNPTTACAMTQVSFTGHWEIIAGFNTQMTISGSDNDMWSSGYCNIDTSRTAPASGTPYFLFPSLEKTKIGYIYFTISPGWTGMSLQGGAHAVSMFGPTFEGTSGTPATYPLLNVSAGTLTIYGGRFHYLKPASGVNGVILQSGGQLTLDSPTWDNSSYTSALPFVYQTGGHCCLINPFGVNSGNTINFRETSGTTVTAAPGAITYA